MSDGAVSTRSIELTDSEHERRLMEYRAYHAMQPDRDAQPEAGLNAALGDAFTYQGKPYPQSADNNEELDNEQHVADNNEEPKKVLLSTPTRASKSTRTRTKGTKTPKKELKKAKTPTRASKSTRTKGTQRKTLMNFTKTPKKELKKAKSTRTKGTQTKAKSARTKGTQTKAKSARTKGAQTKAKSMPKQELKKAKSTRTKSMQGNRVEVEFCCRGRRACRFEVAA